MLSSNLDGRPLSYQRCLGRLLVTTAAAEFDRYMEVLANRRALPLLQALVGPALHLMEAGARTVVAQPRERALESGGYTDWHRDYGSILSDPQPNATPGGDYNRVKCFVMLSDTEREGGPLGLVPGSHLWAAAGPPEQYRRGNQGKLPGHVKVAVPAGGPHSPAIPVGACCA
eukprot:COSAG05_NODE_2057_length_3631_cov_3.848528_3_plen_172_part_00